MCDDFIHFKTELGELPTVLFFVFKTQKKSGFGILNSVYLH